MTPDTLQIGVRSFSREEAASIGRQHIPLCTMEDFRNNRFDVEGAIARMPEPVYLTIDADVFDWSVVRCTGTPEPGGFLWYEALALIQGIFRKKKVIGCDLMELAWRHDDYNCVYAGARLVYKMMGYKLCAAVAERGKWPKRPGGPLFY
jgi:agmatinase